MQTIRRRVEQLELIAELIDANTPSASRMALILTDNFAEIVIDERASHEFAMDSTWPEATDMRWSPSKRKSVQRYFNAKIKFIKNDLGIIDEDASEFIKFGHQSRNRAYHADSYYADTVGCMARSYFGLICRLWPELRTGGICYAGAEADKEFMARYGISSAIELARDGLRGICAQALGKRACPPAEFAGALSENLVRRLVAVTGSTAEFGLLDELVDREADSDAQRDRTLRRLQFAAQIETREGEPIEDRLVRWRSEFDRFVPKVSLSTMRKWIATARDIAKEISYGRAAIRFKGLDEAFTSVEELVHQAVFEHDEHNR